MNSSRNIGGSEDDYRRSELLSCLARAPQSPSARPSHVAALVAFSRRIPDTFLAEQLAQSVRAETGERVLLVRVLPTEAGVPLKSWSLVQTTWHDDFAFAQHLQQTSAGYEKLALRVGDEPLERNYLAAFIGHCARHFPFVLLHVDADTPSRLLTESLRRAEMPLCFLQADTDSYYQFNELARRARDEAKSAVLLKPVLCLEESDPPEKSAEAGREIGAPIHAVLRGVRAAANPAEFSAVFGADLRRLAREIGRCRVGLALSSGAAKGLAHAGVIQVLCENGIEVDMIAGTSMGSYVGALWAAGHNGDFLVEKAVELERPGTMWTLVDPVLPPRRGFMRGLGVKRRLMRSIGEVQFPVLARPLRVVATNLDTLERAVFSTGQVAAAVHASCAIPGICEPVEIDGQHYIDGGISDPLPVDVLREMGIEKIIAVNVIPTSAFLRCSRERAREQAELKTRHWSPLRYLNERLNYFADGNILDIIQQSILGAQIRNAEEACRNANVVLRPLTCEGHWHDFKHPAKYVALGRRVATEHLDEIKALVKRPQPQRPDETSVVERSVAAAA